MAVIFRQVIIDWFFAIDWQGIWDLIKRTFSSYFRYVVYGVIILAIIIAVILALKSDKKPKRKK